METAGQLPVAVLRDFAGKVYEIFESSQRFVLWWTDTKGKVRTCKDSTTTANNQPMSYMRANLLKDQWEKVGERYKNYNRRVSGFPFLPV